MTTPGLRRSDIASSAAWRLKGNFLLLPGSSHGELRARKRPASNRQPWTQTAPWGPCSRREGVNSRFPALSAFPGGHPWQVSRERAAVHSIISVGQQISGEQNAMVTCGGTPRRCGNGPHRACLGTRKMTYPWCSQTSGMGTQCTHPTDQECMYNTQRIGGICTPNTAYDKNAPNAGGFDARPLAMSLHGSVIPIRAPAAMRRPALLSAKSQPT